MRYSAISYTDFTSKMGQKKAGKNLNCFGLIGKTAVKLKDLVLMWAFVFLSLYLDAYKYIFVCVCVCIRKHIYIKNACFLEKSPNYKN